MNKDQLLRMLLEHLSNGGSGIHVLSEDGPEEDQGKSISNAPLEQLVRKYQVGVPLSPGMKVKWKEGLRNAKWPVHGDYGVVVEVFDEPIMLNDDHSQHGSPCFMEPQHGRIAVKGHHGQVLIYTYDFNRFEPV